MRTAEELVHTNRHQREPAFTGDEEGRADGTAELVVVVRTPQLFQTPVGLGVQEPDAHSSFQPVAVAVEYSLLAQVDEELHRLDDPCEGLDLEHGRFTGGGGGAVLHRGGPVSEADREQLGGRRDVVVRNAPALCGLEVDPVRDVVHLGKEVNQFRGRIGDLVNARVQRRFKVGARLFRTVALERLGEPGAGLVGLPHVVVQQLGLEAGVALPLVGNGVPPVKEVVAECGPPGPLRTALRRGTKRHPVAVEVSEVLVGVVRHRKDVRVHRVLVLTALAGICADGHLHHFPSRYGPITGQRIIVAVPQKPDEVSSFTASWC